MSSPVGRYYPAFDGLRALIVFMVFIHHYYGWRLTKMEGAWIGVDISFVLSGFLITGILYDSKAVEHCLRNFYIRRSLRILPLFYGVWILIAVLNLKFHWDWTLAWVFWPANLGNFARFIFFTRANVLHMDILRSCAAAPRWLPYVYIGHFWSLAVEEQFYLFWPFIVLRCKSQRQLIHVCLCFIAGAFLLRLLLAILVSEALLRAELIQRLSVTRIDSQIWGGLLALLLRTSAKAWLSANRTRLTVGAMLLFCGTTLLRTQGYAPHLVLAATYTVIPVLAAVLIHECTHAEGTIARCFNVLILRRLGIISYGFYVFHDLPHGFYYYVASHTPYLQRTPELSTAMIALPSTIVISLISWRYIETPLLRVKKRWSPPAQKSHASLTDADRQPLVTL